MLSFGNVGGIGSDNFVGCIGLLGLLYCGIIGRRPGLASTAISFFDDVVRPFLGVGRAKRQKRLHDGLSGLNETSAYPNSSA